MEAQMKKRLIRRLPKESLKEERVHWKRMSQT